MKNANFTLQSLTFEILIDELLEQAVETDLVTLEVFGVVPQVDMV